MKYDFRRDLFWLILRPWIWIPRVLQIIFSTSFLAFRFLLTFSSKEVDVQRKLAKSLLKTITELGPCFIKVGQALSTRPDLIRRDWLEELTNLQDNLPPFNQEKAINIVEKELGSSVDQLFKEFPLKPIASASLGQVYKAKLFSDIYVAVKVQRPDLTFIIRRDLVLLKILCQFISPLLPLNLGVGLGEIIDEFGKSLFEEIDYKKEAENAGKFSALFDGNHTVTIPKVEHQLSSEKVLTTSWINGVKLRNRQELLANNLDPSALIRTGVTCGIQQLLEFGYFHADPHPGNMFALEGLTEKHGHIAYVDFGMMDEISDFDRTTLISAIVHLINKDYLSLAEDFQSLGFLKNGQDLKIIAPVLEEVLGNAIGKEVSNFNFKEITNRFSELMFNYPFIVPPRFALIIRAVISQEGLALRLDPKFKILKLAYPYVAKRLLTLSTDEMLNILLEVIFDSSNQIRVDRLEDLLNILGEDSKVPTTELIPVAEAGIKLLLSKRGHPVRRNLLMSLIKDEKINTKDIKNLLKLLVRTYNPKKVTRDIFQIINPLAA